MSKGEGEGEAGGEAWIGQPKQVRGSGCACLQRGIWQPKKHVEVSGDFGGDVARMETYGDNRWLAPMKLRAIDHLRELRACVRIEHRVPLPGGGGGGGIGGGGEGGGRVGGLVQ